MEKKVGVLPLILGGIGILFFLFFTVLYPIDMGTGHFELENILFLAIPCFFYLSFSFTIKEESKRKKILIFYLICYLLLMFHFVFSSNRYQTWIAQGIMKREYNFIPFHSILELLHSPLGFSFAFYNIIGNFLMLTPLSILLPFLFPIFQKKKNYFIFLGCLCFLIEGLQFWMGLGSFDIDDFILNISGAMLFLIFFQIPKVNSFWQHFFLKQQIPKKYCFGISCFLIFFFLLVCMQKILVFLTEYQENKIDFSQLQCQADQRVYLGDVGNYHYYSKCDYGTTSITVGKQKYTLSNFIHSRYFEKTMDQLSLEREEIITNVIFKEKTEEKQLLFTDPEINQNYYLYGYRNMFIEKDNQMEEVMELLQQQKINIAFIYSLTDLSFFSSHYGYSIHSGKYYQILNCGGRWEKDGGNIYLLDLNFSITEDSCAFLEKQKTIISETRN